MNCRIIYKDNKIDHVQAENGERSILFDSLKDIFGAEKALELYALTEEDGYKQKIQEKVRSFVGVTEKQIDKLSEAIDAQETLNKLVETGLADNVYQMTSEEIEAKLVELGVEAEVAKQVVAYHGSPYSFFRFTTNAIGTGEGAQAFGWGLYFTDLENIARNYAKVLSANNSENVAKKLLGRNKIDINADFATDFINNVRDNILISNSKEELINTFKNYVTYNENLVREIEEDVENYPLEKEGLLKELSRIKNTLLDNNKALEIVKEITDSEFNTAKNGKGSKNLYKVTLHKGKTPSEYTWLEWDKSLSKNLANRLLEKAKNDENLAKSSIIFKLENPENYVGKDIYGELNLIFRSGKEASMFLLDAGIDGIKYPAESISRGATSDTARGFNYVVFDENAITIEEQIQFQKSLSQVGIDMIVNGFVVKEYPNNSKILDILIAKNIIEKVC